MVYQLDDKLTEFVICLSHKDLMQCKLCWFIILQSEFRLKHKPALWFLMIFLIYDIILLILLNCTVACTIIFEIDCLQKFILISANGLNEENICDLIKISDYLLEIDISLVEKGIWIERIDAIKHQFLILYDITLCLLRHRGTMHVNKERYLSF